MRRRKSRRWLPLSWMRRFKKVKNPIVAWVKEHRNITLLIVVAPVMCVSFIAVWLANQFAQWLYPSWGGKSNEDIRNTILVLAGVGALCGLWIRSQQLNLAKKTQETDILARAVEQLGNKEISIRCAGARLLQRVSDQNSENSILISKILIDFVSVKLKAETSFEMQKNLLEKNIDKLEEDRKDVEIALQILGKIVTYSGYDTVDAKFGRIDLSYFDFRKMNVRHTNFQGYILQATNWERSSMAFANFRNAVLSNAFFKRAHMQGTNFEEAELFGSNFEEAHLQFANLNATYFGAATLERANLDRVKVKEAVFAESNLRYVKLTHAEFDQVDLMNAKFHKTDCTGSNFSNVKALKDREYPKSVLDKLMRIYVQGDALYLTLTQKQVDGMIYDTMYPPTLPEGFDLPKDGAFQIHIDENGKRDCRYVKSGEYLSPSEFPWIY